MSNAIYPELPGLDFGVTRSPRWKTQIKTTPSDREYRATDIVSPRYAYGLKYEFLRSRAAFQELQTLVGFFNARRGSFDNFLFRDPDDNAASGQQFAIADGVTTSWQLVRDFGGFLEAPDRLAEMPRVSVDGALANLLQANQALGSATWWTGTATITANVENNIFGSLAADRVEDTSTVFTQDIRQEVPVLDDAGPYMAQVYVRKTSGGTSPTLRVVLRFLGGLTEIEVNARLNTDTGTLLSLSDADAEVVSHSATYWRLRLRLANNATGNTTARLLIQPAMATNNQSVFDVTATGSAVLSTLGLYRVNTALQDVAHSNLIYTVTATGAVTIAGGPPTAGQVLTWSGAYLWRMRFADDTLTPEKFADKFWKLGRVDLITLKGES